MRSLKFALFVIFAPLAALAADVTVGEDGLHKQPFHRITFKDMAEDLAEATDEGKRLAIIFEQRGCIYCTKLNEEVFTDPDVRAFIEENFHVFHAVDGHTGLAHIAQDAGVIAVIATVRRQIEGDRNTLLPCRQIAPIEGV